MFFSARKMSAWNVKIVIGGELNINWTKKQDREVKHATDFHTWFSNDIQFKTNHLHLAKFPFLTYPKPAFFSNQKLQTLHT